MTIHDTLKRIEAYGQQLDAHVGKLSEVAPPSLHAMEQIGSRPDARNVLMAIFVDQFAGAMARLRAVYSTGECSTAPASERQPASPVVDVTDYKEIPSGS